MITALSYLIESVPWIRRTSNNKIFRWEGSNWKEINKIDISKLCQVEAQVSFNYYAIFSFFLFFLFLFLGEKFKLIY